MWLLRLSGWILMRCYVVAGVLWVVCRAFYVVARVFLWFLRHCYVVAGVF